MYPYHNEKIKLLSVDKLKSLWDEYDGANEPSGYLGEDIHYRLNELGYGEYCAV
jgi:hypothetical protein